MVDSTGSRAVPPGSDGLRRDALARADGTAADTTPEVQPDVRSERKSGFDPTTRRIAGAFWPEPPVLTATLPATAIALGPTVWTRWTACRAGNVLRVPQNDPVDGCQRDF